MINKQLVVFHLINEVPLPILKNILVKCYSLFSFAFEIIAMLNEV
ncbi:hypothetical protein SAMN05660477_02546 [Soonwooa buanensis]|uniref:Uncharacterized protein n=1 Tax=Soonwooa buanensis TaxID=619805 RepID=A0A1T5G346_9FLAO|nr:hypothetical protein SAMN05660477_02546 [Soonwooa buanensis]